MKRLIEAIRDGEIIHYLYGYTAAERNKIIRVIKKEFKADVRIISTVIHWKEIKTYSERIKILIYTDKIINKYRLGTGFKSLINDGSIYLFFSRNRIDDFNLKQHWFNFLKTLDSRVKYKYRPKKRKKIIGRRIPAKEEGKINYRRTASFISHFILIFLVIIYIAQRGMREKSVEGFDLVLLTCTTLDVVNLFLGFHVYNFLRKNVEPFVYNQLKKRKKIVWYINKYFKAIGNTIKPFLKKVKNDRDMDEE